MASTSKPAIRVANDRPLHWACRQYTVSLLRNGISILHFIDGKSMGDTRVIYSEALRPGCQQVLRRYACVGFSSILHGMLGSGKGHG